MGLQGGSEGIVGGGGGTPDDGSVTAAKIAAGAVEASKLAATVISGQTAETAIADGDLILIYDVSAGALRTMTKANFVAGLGGGAYAGLTPSTMVEIVEDFIGNNTNDEFKYDWVATLSGAGADFLTVPSASIWTAGRAGIVYLETGSTSTGYVFVSLGTGLSPSALGRCGGGVMTFETSIYLPNLADAGQDYVLRVGFGDDVTAADNDDGIYFEYDRSTSVNWRICCASGGVRTKTTSATAVGAAAWIRLKWVVNAGGTSVEFFVDGVSVGTITTNIPTTGWSVPMYKFGKTAGATTRVLHIDYCYFRQDFTLAR